MTSAEACKITDEAYSHLNKLAFVKEPKRDPAFEEDIKGNMNLSFFYAILVIKGRFPACEDVMKVDPKLACNYAEYAIRGRFHAAEPYIRKDPYCWLKYIKNLLKDDAEEVKWGMIRDENLTIELFDFLNRTEMSPKIQEYVCQHRPDLISKILDLDPSLSTKYQHELELSRVDL